MNRPARTVLVKGVAGLGNRLATLCAAIEYAKATNRSLFVDWSDPIVSDGRTNVFEDYFHLRGLTVTPPPMLDASDVYPRRYAGRLFSVHNEVYQDVSSLGSARWANLLRRLPRGRARMLAGHWSPRETAEGSTWRSFFDPDSFPKGEDLSLSRPENTVIFADFIPRASASTLLTHVGWAPAFAARLDSQRAALIPQGTVGVHVRFSDKTPRGTDILERVRREMAAHNLIDRPIFLASDSDRIVEAFMKVFPRVICARALAHGESRAPYHLRAEKDGDPSLARAIVEESLMDMGLLSACEWLLYQGNSAFTWAPRAWHGNPTQQIDWDRASSAR